MRASSYARAAKRKAYLFQNAVTACLAEVLERASRRGDDARMRSRARAKQAAPLAGAAIALERGELAGALALALEAWRACRAGDLADAIEQLGRLLPPARGLVATAGPALRAELAARADADDPADFELLATAPLPRSHQQILERLRRFADRSPDPRFASLLHRLLEAPPAGNPAFWREMFALVAVAGDPRSIARLRDLDLERLVRPSSLETLARRRDETITALRKSYPRMPALGTHTTQLARLAVEIRRRQASSRGAALTGDQLLAEIRNHPDDDGPRIVYADWLQERGDPRGALIALQLGGGEPRQIRALLDAHAATWLGAIATVAVHAHTRFARGFAVAVTINPRNETYLRSVVGAPEWFSVEELTISGMFAESTVCADLIRHPCMRSLRDVRGLGSAPAAALAIADPALAITTLHVRGGYVVSQLGDARGMPSLERVVIAEPGALADLISLTQMPVAARLRSIALETGPTTLELRADPPGVWTEMALDLHEHGALRLDRNAIAELSRAGAIGRLAITTHAPIAAPLEARLRNLFGPLWDRRQITLE
jgi:uncharacterized protein (TIGR02996 family)